MPNFQQMGGLPIGYSQLLQQAQQGLVRLPDGTFGPAPQFGGNSSLDQIYQGMYAPSPPQVPQMGMGGNTYDATNDPRFAVSGGFQPGTWGNGPPQVPRPPQVPGALPQGGPQTQPNSALAAIFGAVPEARGSSVIGKADDRLMPQGNLAFAGGGDMPPMPRIDPRGYGGIPPMPRPDPRGYGAPPAPAQITVRGGNAQPAQGGDTYTVKKGDTPWDISQRTGVPVSTLMANNGITDPRKLQIGATLNLSSSPTSAPMPMPSPGFRNGMSGGPMNMGSPNFAQSDPWGELSMGRPPATRGLLTGAMTGGKKPTKQQDSRWNGVLDQFGMII